MRRSLLSASALVALAASVAVATPSATAATGPLKFGTFRADPAGNDLPITNTKLNGEYVVVTNTTTRAITMTGYRVHDYGRKFTYAFPRGYVIGAKKSVTLRTGRGTNSSTNLYWGQSSTYIWNNTGDTATLLNPSGRVVHSCTYKTVSTGVKYC